MCYEYFDMGDDEVKKLFNFFHLSEQHHMAEKPTVRSTNVKLSIDIHCVSSTINSGVNTWASLYVLM